MSHLEDTNLGSSLRSNVIEPPGIAEVADQSRAGRESSPSHGSLDIQAPTGTRSTNTNRSVISGDESSSGKVNINRSRNNTGRSEQEIQELLVMRTHSAPPGESGEDRQQKKFQPFKSKAAIDSQGSRRAENSPALSSSSSIPATPPTAALPSPVVLPTSATASPVAAPQPTPASSNAATTTTTSQASPSVPKDSKHTPTSKDSPKTASPSGHSQPLHHQHQHSPRFNNGRNKNSPYADPYHRGKGMPSPQQQRYDLPPPQMAPMQYQQLPPTIVYPVQSSGMHSMPLPQGYPANGNFPPGAIPISMLPHGAVPYPGQPHLFFVPGQPPMMARPMYQAGPQHHVVYEQAGLRGPVHLAPDMMGHHSPQQRMQGYKQSPGRGSPNVTPNYPRGSPRGYGDSQHPHPPGQSMHHQHHGSPYSAPRPPVPPQQQHKSSPGHQGAKPVDNNKKKLAFKDKSGNVLSFSKSTAAESTEGSASIAASTHENNSASETVEENEAPSSDEKVVDLSSLRVSDTVDRESMSEVSMTVNIDDTESKDDGEVRSISQVSTVSMEITPKLSSVSPAAGSVTSSLDINSVDAVIGGDDRSDTEYMRSEASTIPDCSPLPPPAMINAAVEDSTSDSSMTPPPYEMEASRLSDNDSPALQGENISSSPDTRDESPAQPPVNESRKPCAADPPVETRSKKCIRKEKLAAADLNPGGSLLDAYTTPKPQAAPAPAHLQKPVVAVEQPKPPAEPEVENDWEAQAAKVMEEGLPIKAPSRSLRPGGGMGKMKLNAGPKPPSPVFRQTYTKEELLKLRPVPGTQFERPASMPQYSPIVYLSNDGAVVNPAQRGGRPSYQDSPKQQWKTPYQQMGQQNEPGWQRGYHAPSKKHRAPVPPMPKKVIEDPMEIVSRDAQEILNKITPQTFEKLTDKFGDIPVANYATLKLIAHLIFEKATAEPNYAHLYVEMCTRLDSRQIVPSFCAICELPETKQYRWIRELPVSPVAGPFNSPDDAISAALALINLSPPPSRMRSVQVLAIGDTLIHLMLGDNDLYYVFYTTFGELPPEAAPNNLFSSYEAAKKSCCKKHYLARLLVEKCQDEYMGSTETTGRYSELEPMIEKLKADAPSLSEEEYLQRAADIEEFRGFLKRRLLGNIRLIGELFKQCTLIRSLTMHKCLQDILMKKNQRVDEQEMEVVCKLLHAIGSNLEMKATDDEKRQIDLYFQKLREFSTDRSFTSRMRFQINDILDLRRNNWVERRALEKPTLVEDIRQKAMYEQQQQQQGKRGSIPIAPGLTAMRKPQQQGRSTPPDTRYRQDPRMNRAEGAPIQRHQSAGPSGGRGGYEGQDIRRIQSESKHDRNRSGGSSGGEVFSHVKEVEDMPLDLVRKRVKGLVEEYLMTRSDSEAVVCMTELPMTASGELVCVVIDKLLDSRKDEVHSLLYRLLEVLMPSLQSAPVFVESALRTCEPLLCLSDFTMDNHNAPEVIGNILNRVLASGACNRGIIIDIIEGARRANRDDEFGVPDEELAVLHNRLMAVIR